jgi:predicted DNA binding protein
MFIKKSKKSVYVIKGDDESVKNFFKAIEILGKIEDIKIQKLESNECNILSNLTGNQKKILNFAKKYGYYDYPRRITSNELSEIAGFNAETTLELLRKAEKLIFSIILDDKNN